MSDQSERMTSNILMNYMPSTRMTGHDSRLYNNDPVVHNVATQLVVAMKEFGILKVASAFRAAVAIYNYQKYVEQALEDIPKPEEAVDEKD